VRIKLPSFTEEQRKSNRQTRVIKARVTLEEYDAIEKRRQITREKISLSAYIREMCLPEINTLVRKRIETDRSHDDYIHRLKLIEAIRLLTNELQKQGNNLNQITKAINGDVIDGTTWGDYKEAIEGIHKINEEIAASVKTLTENQRK
jgi:Bacterial mobilisation protein (MobC)